MKLFLSQLAAQLAAILLAALAAAALAFAQSLSSASLQCVPPVDAASTAAGLGFLIKAVHSAAGALTSPSRLC